MTEKDTIHKLKYLLFEYRGKILIIIGCLLVSEGLNLCIPLISKQIMDEGFLGGDRALLVKLVLLTMGIYVVNSLIDIVKEKKRVDISARLQYGLAEQSFSHLMRLKISYFNNTNYAEILNNINMDINKISMIADNSVFFVVTQAFSMIGGIIGLFIIDYRMTVLVLMFIPAKYIVMKYFAKKQKALMDECITVNQKYAAWFGDTVGGVKEVKTFNLFASKHREFDEKQKFIVDNQKHLYMLTQWNSVTDTLMIELLSTILYIVGANMVFDFQLSVGSVFAFITYSAYVTGPISAILNIGYLLSGIIPSTQRYYEFMELPEERDVGEIEDFPLGDLRLDKVCFSYLPDKNIFDELSITFPQGQKTAVVGKNGVGKTTLINLLTRLYTPDVGKIYLGDVNIEEISLSQYRKLFSIVSQQIYLFDGTIRDNIRLDQSVDDHTIYSICCKCGLKDFIDEVTLDYQVGSNGALLSGGQKQKIALARALVADTPIIILDEATSNTDTYSEKQINNLLHKELREKTVIVITHKVDILKEVDQIVVLREGKVDKVCRYSEMDGEYWQDNVSETREHH